MTPRLYGIRNCDTVKKARKWLESRNLDYAFHDLREDDLDPALLARWCADPGWEVLLNRRSTTWRQLDEAARTDLDATKAMALMQGQPTLIKRPVLDTGDQVVVGFAEARYREIFDQDGPG